MGICFLLQCPLILQKSSTFVSRQDCLKNQWKFTYFAFLWREKERRLRERDTSFVFVWKKKAYAYFERTGLLFLYREKRLMPIWLVCLLIKLARFGHFTSFYFSFRTCTISLSVKILPFHFICYTPLTKVNTKRWLQFPKIRDLIGNIDKSQGR